MTIGALSAILYGCPVPDLTDTMNATNSENSSLAADFNHGRPLDRRPITNVTAWLDDFDPSVRSALRALGELLAGVAAEPAAIEETAEKFTARCLDVPDCASLINEERTLDPVSRLTTAVALAEWIDQHACVCEIGPGEYTNPPKWTQSEVGGVRHRHPLSLRAYFPAGTLLDSTGCVISIEARESILHSTAVSAYVTSDQHEHAQTVVNQLIDRANALNPYRGRAVRASFTHGLSLEVIELPSTLTRQNVIVADEVWTEIDLGVSSVRDRHMMLNAHGLGARRGVLLCGPPGTGKSAVSAVVANEVVGEFTVIYVEAKAGAALLTAVVTEAQRLGGPVLLVLEDVDLWCCDRSTGGGGLSELLQAMDIRPEARILTLASTNDAATLDKAAIRTGRFDSIVEVGYPNRQDAARILAMLLADLAGNQTVDVAAVVDTLPPHTSGSDIREIVRRAVLSSNIDGVTTAGLIGEVGSGRYRASISDGLYL